MAKKISDRDKEKDERKREQIVTLYKTRLTHLKRAQVLFKDEKVNQSVESYNKYLGILALYFETTEERLSPALFDPVKDMTEMLLISHAYWDLAKAYDRSPSLQGECFRCLEQFIKFSIGFKYQHVNAQIIRKFNNKKQAHNPKAFENAYQRIQIASKKCYIATMCFGENHPNTNLLRQFKYSINNLESGKNFIDWYYSWSPHIVDFLQDHLILKLLLEFIFIKPFLLLFIIITRPYVRYKKTLT